MLHANEEQQRHIEKLLIGTDLMYATEKGIRVDSSISYEQMAMVVDYLRTYDKKDELFEECWITYKRKGSKKQSKYQWEKLNEKEKQLVLPHIKAYTSSREIQYQKDFERYLRDKIFTEIVYNKNNQIVFDPSKINSKNTTMAYLPELSPLLMWNDYYNCYMYLGYWDWHISDGYNDDNRPNGAQITLNNGRGIIKWDANNKKWVLQNENQNT